MKEIPLTQGKIAIVDDEDYTELSKYKWHVVVSLGRFYAEHTFWDPIKKRGHNVSMARIILNVQNKNIVVYKNKNTLDLRRENLLITSRSEHTKHIDPIRYRKTPYRRPQTRVCSFIKKHHEELKDDSERLSSKFLLEIMGREKNECAQEENHA